MAGHVPEVQFDVHDAAVVRSLRVYLDAIDSTTTATDDASGSESFKRWARRRLFIRTQRGEGESRSPVQVVPFELNGIQRRLEAMRRRLRMQGRPPRLLVLKYRRGGVTTWVQGRWYRLAASRPNTEVLTVAHTKEATAKIFRIARLMHRRDAQAPPILGPGSRYQLDFRTLNSLFSVATAGGRGVARGEGLQAIHWSEVAKSLVGPNQVADQEDLLAGLTEAADDGEIVLETTANGIELFAQKYREAKAGRNEWAPVFFPWFYDQSNRLPVNGDGVQEILDTLTDRERFLIERHGLTVEQIAWRRSKKKDLGRLFPQEYPEDDETCFITSGICYFDTEEVVGLLELIEDYPRQHVAGGYYVEWEPPQDGVEYVAGTDTSEGRAGCDPNGLGVLRTDTGAQVASLHGLFPPDDLAERSVKICKRYNEALLGVEQENHGHAVLLRVRQLGYTVPQRQLFYRKFIKNRGWRDPGWSTNAVSRPIMLDELASAVAADEGSGMGIRDRDFLGECLTFRKQSSGKWEADSGCHDDTVMKWAIAWQMRKVRRRRKPQIHTVRLRAG